VLAERHDLAYGTSRWSSKLVHGGLRYLARGEVGIAYESAVERGLIMARLAPHLTRALPLVLPRLPRQHREEGPSRTGVAGSRAGTGGSLLPVIGSGCPDSPVAPACNGQGPRGALR